MNGSLNIKRELRKNVQKAPDIFLTGCIGVSVLSLHQLERLLRGAF